jgi:hypothetical protein
MVATVTFANNPAMPIEGLTLMGVNVKKGANPIGFFGTGLKFAIATLLRTGHKVEIFISGVRHDLSLKEKIIRDVPFQIVCLDGEELGFTTETGKNWQVWQAYRELSCNAMDEQDWYVGFSNVANDELATIIRVTGAEIEQVHNERHRYFCEAKLIQRVKDIGEVREGESRTIFYRGVRVYETEKPMLFTYNLIAPLALTEDRTMANSFMLPSIFGKLIAGLDHHDMIARAVRAEDAWMEHKAEFGAVQHYTEAFMAVMTRNAANWRVNNSAKRFWQELRPKEDPYKPVPIDATETAMLTEALSLAEKVDPECRLSLEEIRICGFLGEGVIGLFREGQIYLSKDVFKQGMQIVAGTVYEEWLHRDRGLADESRSMQNYLINQIMLMAQR